ncbi:MAG: NPXTG-anchored protein [Oscillospiraceae bacterium]
MNIRRFISAAAASAMAAGLLSVCTYAEDAPAGYVYFMADKTTIGQGFTVQPTKVAFYEGDTGLDVVERAVDYVLDENGNFIYSFADEGGEPYFPDAVAEVCPEVFGRVTEGYLSMGDYTSDSLWLWFVNDELAQENIGEYIPVDGDVICYEFTVFCGGADLGLDYSSLGGSEALKPLTNKAELIKACAEIKEAGKTDEPIYNSAMEALAIYESTQEDIDIALDSVKKVLSGEISAVEPDTTPVAEEDKGSPDTGVEGIAAAAAIAVLAGAGIALSRKRR